MTKSRNTLHLLSGLIMMLVLILPATLWGQYIDLRLEIETESTVKTEKLINFGSFKTNVGTVDIVLGDVNMGVFSINAIESQELLISYNKPQYMIHTNPSIADRIPFDSKVEYGFSRNNFRETKVLSKNLNNILIRKNPDAGPWSSLYMFIFGSVEIGNIAPGNYATDVILTIQYI